MVDQLFIHAFFNCVRDIQDDREYERNKLRMKKEMEEEKYKKMQLIRDARECWISSCKNVNCCQRGALNNLQNKPNNPLEQDEYMKHYLEENNLTLEKLAETPNLECNFFRTVTGLDVDYDLDGSEQCAWVEESGKSVCESREAKLYRYSQRCYDVEQRGRCTDEIPEIYCAMRTEKYDTVGFYCSKRYKDGPKIFYPTGNELIRNCLWSPKPVGPLLKAACNDNKAANFQGSWQEYTMTGSFPDSFTFEPVQYRALSEEFDSTEFLVANGTQ